MSQEAFLRNSAYIQSVLLSAGSDDASLPKEHVFGIVKYSLGSWIKTGAVMSSNYFTHAEVAEPEDPIIEPLEAERDDEILTPTPEQLEAIDQEALQEDLLPDQDPDEPDLVVPEPTPEESEEHDPTVWDNLTLAIDQYFSFINRLVLFSPEMHKEKWRAFMDEAEQIFNKPSLTPVGMANRFKLVESLYRETTAL